MILGKDGVERLPPPVGTSDWATFSRDSYCVDKTLMIKELIDGKKYDTAFRAEGITDIEKIGLAYCKNKVEISR